MEKLINKITKDKVIRDRVIRMFLILSFLLVQGLLPDDEFPDYLVELIRTEIAGRVYRLEQPVSVRPTLFDIFIKNQNRDTTSLTLFCKNIHIGDSIYKAANDIYVEIYDSTTMVRIPINSRIAYEVHTNPKWPVEWRNKWPELNGEYVYLSDFIRMAFVVIFVINIYYLINELRDAKNE